MKNNPKLSIIIPVYNGAHYIENTVRSILNSSYPNLELLLIDDGSTDDSLMVCNQMAASDPRIKVYHKTNSGIADARNYGLDHAIGDYIGFCDQDDEINPEMYRRMLGRLATDNSQAAICGCYRQKRNGERVIFEKFTDMVYENSQIKNKLLLPMLFKGFAAYDNPEITIYSTIWNCTISRQLIVEKGMRFRSFVSYEDDLIMLLQFLLQSDRISTLSDVLYYWNTNVHSEIHRSAVRYLPDLEVRQQNLVNFITESLSRNKISPEIINQYRYVQQCRNALLQLDNAAAQSSRNFLSKIRELRNCSSILYLQSAPDRVNPAKGFVRNTVILPLLRRKHVAAAYLMNRAINAVRFFVEKYHITEKLERKIKSAGKNTSA